MASREGSAMVGAIGISIASRSAESPTGASAFGRFRVVRGADALRRGLGSATLEVDSGVTTASTSAAGGTGVGAGAEARRTREEAVWRRGLGAASEVAAVSSGLVFLFICFCGVLFDAFFIVGHGNKNSPSKVLILPLSTVSFQTTTSEYW
jgi:hypothetical protein